MTRAQSITHECWYSREIETEAGEVWELYARVRVDIRYTPPGPLGGTYCTWQGSWDPPDDAEVDAVAIDIRMGNTWQPAPPYIAEWVEGWLRSGEWPDAFEWERSREDEKQLAGRTVCAVTEKRAA